MTESHKCASCGADVPGNSPLGQCMACLLSLGRSPQPDRAPAVDREGLNSTSVLPDGQPEDELGRYKVLQKIGEGGCGTVYLAEQQEPVRRQVALKVIKLGMDTREVIARFEAERQALALMDHPNIAKVLDAGATRNGRPFFVMELVRGARITDYCDQNHLSTEQRLELFLQVCQAVQHAHQKGIIHRDLKPSNILVTANEGVPLPKVIDFGIAKATSGQRLTAKTIFTAFEQFLGTPAYMSPEQAEMTGGDVDTRSDIYSLGVLLYELLTGGTPFDAKELLQSGFDAMRQIIRHREPIRPSTRLQLLAQNDLTTTAARRKTEPARLFKLVRGDLDWIVMKCLEKERARRYDTATDLASDIRRHLNTQPVAARPPSNLYRFQKLVRRHKIAFGAGAAVGAALLIGLGASTWLWLREKTARQRANVAESFLGNMLMSIEPRMAQGKDTTLIRQILDTAASRASLDLTNQPEVELNLQATLATAYSRIGRIGYAENCARRILALQEALEGKEHKDVAAALNFLGLTLSDQGRLAEAEELLRRGLEMRRKLLGDHHPDVGESLSNLSLVLLDEHRLAEAEDLQRRALAITREALGPDHENVASSLNNLANILRAAHRFTDAESLQREELALSRKRLGPEDPDLAISLNNLSLLLRDLDKLDEAEALAREALTLRRRLLDPENPDLAVSLDTLARVLHDRGQYPEAERCAREALRIRRGPPAHSPSDQAISLHDLACVLRSEGNLTEAERLDTEALDIRKRLLESQPSSGPASRDNLVVAFNELAMTLLAAKKFPQAEAVTRECLAWPGGSTTVGFPTFHTQALLGESLLGQGKYSEAEPLLLAGYEGMHKNEARLAFEHRRFLLESLRSLVQLYEATGQTNHLRTWKQKLTDFK